MSVSVTGYYPRSVTVFRLSGAAQVVTSRPSLLSLVHVGVDATENEFLHLFASAVAPVLGNVPLFSLGRLKRDVRGRSMYDFNLPGGVFFPTGLALGMSVTNTTFTPTVASGDYIVTVGVVQAP